MQRCHGVGDWAELMNSLFGSVGSPLEVLSWSSYCVPFLPQLAMSSTKHCFFRVTFKGVIMHVGMPIYVYVCSCNLYIVFPSLWNVYIYRLIHSTGQSTESVTQTFRQPTAAFISRRLPKCLNFVSVSLFQCCTSQNTETVIQTFRQPKAAFTDCINLYIVFSSLWNPAQRWLLCLSYDLVEAHGNGFQMSVVMKEHFTQQSIAGNTYVCYTV